MATTNEAAQVCECGHGEHDHTRPAGWATGLRCLGAHGTCRCQEFTRRVEQMPAGEQFRHVTED